MRGWQHLKWLPSTPGYPFIGIRHDGSTVKCRVAAGGIEGEKIENLRGWRVI